MEIFNPFGIITIIIYLKLSFTFFSIYAPFTMFSQLILDYLILLPQPYNGNATCYCFSFINFLTFDTQIFHKKSKVNNENLSFLLGNTKVSILNTPSYSTNFVLQLFISENVEHSVQRVLFKNIYLNITTFINFLFTTISSQ